MNMKKHVLTALREQFNHWEGLLATLSEEQITTPLFDLNWSIKDVITHLWAWQQISIARMEAAGLDREPEFPTWVTALDDDWEENPDGANNRIREAFHVKPWSTVHQDWKKGFLRFIELGNRIPERNLLDSARYPWLKGYPPAFILIASYDHHQEHLEKSIMFLQEHENKEATGWGTIQGRV